MMGDPVKEYKPESKPTWSGRSDLISPKRSLCQEFCPGERESLVQDRVGCAAFVTGIVAEDCRFRNGRSGVQTYAADFARRHALWNCSARVGPRRLRLLGTGIVAESTSPGRGALDISDGYGYYKVWIRI